MDNARPGVLLARIASRKRRQRISTATIVCCRGAYRSALCNCTLCSPAKALSTGVLKRPGATESCCGVTHRNDKRPPLLLHCLRIWYFLLYIRVLLRPSHGPVAQQLHAARHGTWAAPQCICPVPAAIQLRTPASLAQHVTGFLAVRDLACSTPGCISWCQHHATTISCFVLLHVVACPSGVCFFFYHVIQAINTSVRSLTRCPPCWPPRRRSWLPLPPVPPPWPWPWRPPPRPPRRP